MALLHTTSSKIWCLSRLLFVTKYYQQHFSQHHRQAKCTAAVPLQIVELSHSHTTWLLVDTKTKIPLLNHQNRIETTLSTHTRKRQHKHLRIANVSSNIFEAVVANKASPTSGVTRGVRGDICPRASHFGCAKLRSECYVLIMKCQMSADANDYNL